MRIVGGTRKGKRLAAPAGAAVRPTSDRTREALFNILVHGIDGFDLEGARVLDLFAGTGALGLEALSRGAAWCLFVDHGAEARGLIRLNVEALGFAGVAKVWRRDATALGRCAPMPPFDLVFCDPPYGKGLGEAALASALAGGWLASGAVAVLEEDGRAAVEAIEGLTEFDARTYGDTRIRIFRAG
jgi:16S rRNA (guanine966-N2)-methyltransferase